jgi:hypothetical protein
LTAGEVATYLNLESILKVHKLPLVADPPPLVLDKDRVTLNNIDKGRYTISSELPEACKVRVAHAQKFTIENMAELWRFLRLGSHDIFEFGFFSSNISTVPMRS